MATHKAQDPERLKPQDLSFLDGLVEGRDYATIPLTQEQRAIVDVDDWWVLVEKNWFAKWNLHALSFYASRKARKEGGGQRTEYMHRSIMGDPKGMMVDHRNHNTLDNRKDNLRIVTRAENMRNTQARRGSSSKYLGVSWYKPREKWRAQISVDGKRKYLGIFENEVEAALAYDLAAIEHFGEFANLNFPQAALTSAV